MRVPLPGETVYPEHTMGVLSFSLDQRSLRLPQPVKWTVCIEARSVFTISFDGQQWSAQPTDVPDADVRIETTPQTWAAFVLSRPKEERQRLLEAMRISGEQSRVNELLCHQLDREAAAGVQLTIPWVILGHVCAWLLPQKTLNGNLFTLLFYHSLIESLPN